jgi:hypothetical protein
MAHPAHFVQNPYGNPITDYLQSAASYVGLGYVGVSPAMAEAQIQAALAGQWVRTPMEAVPAGERNRVRVGATTRGQAAVKVAYWLAVVARVDRDPKLAHTAAGFIQLAGSDDRSEASIERIFTRGFAALAGRRSRAADYARGTFSSQVTQTASAQRIEQEQGSAPMRAAIAAVDATVGGGARRAGKRALREKAERDRRRRNNAVAGAAVAVILLGALAMRRRAG